tara:strand:+ start:3499 stop:3798 length:300 start_codon:yes stop_codon:yes gene_type:complete
MGRYENTKMKDNMMKRGTSKKVFEGPSKNSTNYSSVPFTDSDLYVITQPGDRLDLLAHQFYKDVNLWWYIARANGLKFMTIKAGTRLRIPATTKYAIGK